MATKRNFWIKLNEHFFNDPRIEYLLEMQGGEGAVIIYQKLLLKGMNSGGNVVFFNERRCDVKFIASAMGVKPAKLRKCVDMLIDMELVVWRPDGSFYLPELVYMIGSESGSAPRMRRKRERDASQNAESSAVTCDTDIEKEKELKKEVEPETDSDSYSEITAEKLPGPSFNELLEICRAGKFRVDIREFMDHYRALNWCKGGKPITDWKAQLRLWDYSKRLQAKQDQNMSGFG